MGKTTIQWTDATWNPVTGCTKVSAGCKNCYAERIFPRPYGADVVIDKDELRARKRRFTDVLTHTDRLDQPLHWRKPRRVFVNSMSDLFHEDVQDTFLDRAFAVMALARPHTFQVLTKRPKRMLKYLESRSLTIDHWEAAARSMGQTLTFEGVFLHDFPLPNVWLGVSVEDQERADERIPLLLQTPAAVRFVSYEPALGPVAFENALADLDWVIVGGESGPGARPFNVEWARTTIKQCRDAGVACFVKQLGARPFEPYSDGTPFADVPITDRKGGEMMEWSDDLRVREFPC